MNIQDVQQVEKDTRPVLEVIFEEQKKLMDKYCKIEGMPETFNIQTAETQQWIKIMVQRVMEEMMEGHEALITETRETMEEHFAEEYVGDVMHFLAESYIIAGMKPEDFPTIEEILPDQEINLEIPVGRPEVSDGTFEILYQIGLMCNTLKAKKWKQTQMRTDENKFKFYAIAAFTLYIKHLKNMGFETEDIRDIYLRKKEVNNFRINTRY